MKKFISLPMVVLLALVASNSFAFLNRFHEGDADWFVKAKVGAAPSIFSSRAHQLMVVPFAGVNPALCSGDTPTCNVGNFADVLQETPLLPKFGGMFNQGVLHVGVEVGRSICERGECFLEFVYNRATGKCYNYCDPFVMLAASAGCPDTGCNSDCSSSSDSCDNGCPTGTSLSDLQSLQDSYSNYQAYGAYIGARHFTNSFWCDSMAFWYGYKIGVLHRNAVNACATGVFNVAAYTAECTGISTLNADLNRTIYCKSNSVSGGLQAGFDYCYSDRLSFQLGFEVVASAGLRGNRNSPFAVSSVLCGSTPLTNVARIPSNIIVSNTGTVLNFPIWFGLTWEFGDFFNSCK